MSWCAFVDESESNRKLDPDVYILAASVLPVGSCDVVLRRRKCMERLLFELPAMGVYEVMMEAREAKQNRHDMALARAMRARKEVPSGFRVDHAFGSGEPLLWLPDIVAGSIVAARCGDPCHLAPLMPLVTICMIKA
ncbi:hypothetical protein GCM10023195_55050 [Actinoallomurus liliacearum]|uniref:DUF3800 domain-containing protein n=1 Tax=Actinoallomurus liliacearum TaxID=1080073 RepID=A0ABP8TSG0_9ACTN